MRNENEFTKTIYFPEKAVKIEIDPYLELADCDTYNNIWPADVNVHLEVFRPKNDWGKYMSNPMRDSKNVKSKREYEKN